MLILLFVLLVAVSAAALAALTCVARARNKRLLLARMQGVDGDVSGGGISVLCSGVCDLKQVENLLSVEYGRYEVVVTLDAWRYPAEFRALVARYRMIRVDHAPSGEFPAKGIRALARSRKRCYRRLVLIDRAQDTASGDFDAGAGVASYDYLLPVREGQYLLPGSVARLAAEVGKAGPCDLVRVGVGSGAQLLSREAAATAGGFGNHPTRHIPRARRCRLWEPVFCSPRQPVRVPPGVRIAAALLLAAGIAAAAWAGMWPLAAVLLTAALVWSAAACVRLALGDLPEPWNIRDGVWRETLYKLGVKNFTLS